MIEYSADPTRRPPFLTLADRLAQRAEQQPDKVAIEVVGGRSVTFTQWDRAASAVARGLLGRGLPRGGRVVLSFGATQWTDFAVAYVGVLRAGGVAVPCSERLVPLQLARIVEQCSAFAVLHDPGRPAVTGFDGWHGSVADVADASEIAEIAEIEDAPDAAAGGSGGLPDAPRGQDLAQIIYTSGTTGAPKGVGATHANLVAGLGRHPRRRPLGHSRHFLHAFPIGTNAGQTMLLNAIDAEPTALIVPQFTPARLARVVADRAVGTVFVVPAMAIELLSSGVLRRFDLSSVQLLGSTAAALPAATAAGLAAALPTATIVNYYTSTEAWPAQLSMVFDPTRPGSVGRPVGGEVRIADAHGRPLPRGEAGDVWLYSSQPRHYVGADAEQSRGTFRGSWVRMGDVGRLDPDGFLYLLDRDQDVIKTGAEKVSTLQVENALHEHPDVADVAVLGVPHPVMGQSVAAVIVPLPGRTAPSLPEVRQFLATRVASHERPSRLQVSDRLPRNDAGKVLKQELLPLFDGAAQAPPEHPAP